VRGLSLDEDDREPLVLGELGMLWELGADECEPDSWAERPVSLLLLGRDRC
jgi:hypothetical protein